MSSRLIWHHDSAAGLAIFCCVWLPLSLGSCSSAPDSSTENPFLPSIAEEITAGGQHVCVRFLNGSVRCWGDNYYCQSGVPSSADGYFLHPTEMQGVHDVIRASLGFEHTCVLLRDHTAMCWGQNDYGQLGNGDVSEGGGCAEPSAVAVMGRIVDLAHGSCALLDDGTVRCWGEFSPLDPHTIPAEVPGLSGVTAIAGNVANCAILQDRTVQCWGVNATGQLGDGTLVARANPGPVVGLEDVVEISLGGAHSCARIGDGTVRCWGENSWGEVGDGTGMDTLWPVAIPGLSGVRQIAAGQHHTCVVSTDGRVWCWGDNSSGALGDGTHKDRLSPTLVVGLHGVRSIAAGGSFTCALLEDRSMSCWGANDTGQLGNGTVNGSNVPVPVVW